MKEFTLQEPGTPPSSESRDITRDMDVPGYLEAIYAKQDPSAYLNMVNAADLLLAEIEHRRESGNSEAGQDDEQNIQMLEAVAIYSKKEFGFLLEDGARRNTLNSALEHDVLTQEGLMNLSGELGKSAKLFINELEGFIEFLSAPTKNVDIFVEGLVDFVTQKAADASPNSKESLGAFLQEIREIYFSFSPNIVSRCTLGGLLRLGAKANRVPEIQGWFGQTAVGEITYALAFMGDEVMQGVEKSLEGLPLSEELDVINFLQTVAADAIASGSWSRPALKRIEALLHTLQRESESPFLDCALGLSLDRIGDEKDEPSLGFVTFHGNGEHGRLSERLQDEQTLESDRLSCSIRSSIPLGRGDKYLRISQDAIAILDRTNTPKYYARIREDGLGERAKIDMRAVERIRQTVENPRNLSRYNVVKVLDYVNSNIMSPALGANLESPVELGALWSKSVGALSSEEWTGLFSAKQRVDGAKHELQSFEFQKQKEAENKNEVASNLLVMKVYDTISALIEEGEEAPRGWPELKKLISEEDLGDEAFEITEKIFDPYRFADWMPEKAFTGLYARPEVEALSKEWEVLDDLHQNTFESAQLEIEERYRLAERERKEVIIHYNQLLEYLASRPAELQDGLMGFIADVESGMASDLPIVSFAAYSELSTDKNVNPFPGNETANLPLLMQQLHRPLMRQRVEEDFGISLADFNLNSQIHLLQFLASKNKETYGRIQGLLRQDLPYKQEFLVSFLSCAGDYPFGDKLVRIAENYSAEVSEKIFGKYAELVGVSESTKEYLKESFGSELSSKPGLEEQIVEKLLKQGRSILENAAEEGVDEAEILMQLEHSKGDLLLFANAFRGMYGKDFQLEQFKELRIEHVAGGILTQEECDQMLVMADRNWQDLKGLMPEMYDQIMHDVPAQLQGKNPKTGESVDSTWHLMKKGETVLGFFRLDNTQPDTVYFGSMNSLPDLHGFKLGDAILREMLTKETEGKLMEAHASPKTPICRSYINKYGFVGTGLLSYYETGEQLISIDKEQRPGMECSYALQGKTFVQLELEKDAPGCEIAEYRFTEDFAGAEYQRFLSESQQRFDRGLVLSAHVADTNVLLIDPVSQKKVSTYLAGFEPKEGTSLT